MVARGMRRDALGRLRVIKAKDGIGCAAHLECAGNLKVLAFEEQLRAGKFVQISRGQNLGAANVRLDALMRIQHVLIGWDIHVVHILHHAASFAELGEPCR